MRFPNALSALALLAVLTSPAFAAPAFKVASSSYHQPVKAEIQDATPAHFTINLKKAANMGVNQDAKTFAMYTTAKVPSKCGDFTKTSISYQKPDKYHRVFDLRKQPQVLTALDQYGCVIIANKPKLPPAKP